MESGLNLHGERKLATDVTVPCGLICNLFDEKTGEALIKVSGYQTEGQQPTAPYLRRVGAQKIVERGNSNSPRTYTHHEQYVIDIFCDHLAQRGWTVVASVNGDKTDTLKYPDSDLLMDARALSPLGVEHFFEIDASNDIDAVKREYINNCPTPVWKIDVHNDMVLKYLKTEAPTWSELSEWYSKNMEHIRGVKLSLRVNDPISITHSVRPNGNITFNTRNGERTLFATLYQHGDHTKLVGEGINHIYIGDGSPTEHVDAAVSKIRRVLS